MLPDSWSKEEQEAFKKSVAEKMLKNLKPLTDQLDKEKERKGEDLEE